MVKVSGFCGVGVAEFFGDKLPIVVENIFALAAFTDTGFYLDGRGCRTEHKVFREFKIHNKHLVLLLGAVAINIT